METYEDYLGRRGSNDWERKNGAGQVRKIVKK